MGQKSYEQYKNKLFKRAMEGIVFNDSEVWRFSGENKKLLAVEMGFGVILP